MGTQKQNLKQMHEEGRAVDNRILNSLDLDRVKDFRAKGYTINKISFIYGITKRSLYRILKRAKQ